MSDGHIFISYRRDDSAGYTRAIHDQLAQNFSKNRIFMDVDAIEPGLPFDEVINQAVARCEILLVMIGARWMEQRGDVGPRINDPKDFVRIEIAAALSRNIRVIPVLLDGATMPTEDSLPEPLRALARRNAIEVDNTRFDSDVERLIETVSKVLGEPVGSPSRDVQRSRRPVLYWLLGGGVAAVAMVPVVRFALPRMNVGTWLGWTVQEDWRFCRKCQTLFFNGDDAKGSCPAGGAHDAEGYTFMLEHDVPGAGQDRWRSCQKCRSLFYDGYATKGVCPAGGDHVAGDYDFVLEHDDLGWARYSKEAQPAQGDWRFCDKCQSLFFDGFAEKKGVCPAGGVHNPAGYNFILARKPPGQ